MSIFRRFNKSGVNAAKSNNVSQRSATSNEEEEVRFDSHTRGELTVTTTDHPGSFNVTPHNRRIEFTDIIASKASIINGEQEHSTVLRDISRDSEDLRSTISEHLNHLRDTWSKLRDVIRHDPKKYELQIKFLDYLHLCEQASTYLSNNIHLAEIYCNSAQELISDNWRLYYLRSDIAKRQGKYTRAEADLKRMRECMRDTDQNSPESLVMYYGLKIDNMITNGKEGRDGKDVRRQFQKVVEALKAKSATSSTNSTNEDVEGLYVRQFSEMQQQITDPQSGPSHGESLKKKKKTLTLQKGSIFTNFEEDVPNSPSALQGIIDSAKIKLMESEFKKMMDSELSGLKIKIDSVASHISDMDKHLDNVDKQLQFITFHMNAIKNSLTLVQQKISEESSLCDGLNDMLVEYFKAFIFSFSQAYTSAKVLHDGKVSIDTDSLLKTGVSGLLGLVPFCGETLSTIAETGFDIVQTHILRENAAALIRMAYSEQELWNILKVVAKDITHNTKKIAELESPHKEDKPEKGVFKKLFSKISAIKEKVQDAIEGGQIYKTEYAQAAYEDVSHVIPEWIKHAKSTSTNKGAEQHSFFESSKVIQFLELYLLGEEAYSTQGHTHFVASHGVNFTGQSYIFPFQDMLSSDV